MESTFKAGRTVAARGGMKQHSVLGGAVAGKSAAAEEEGGKQISETVSAVPRPAWALRGKLLTALFLSHSAVSNARRLCRPPLQDLCTHHTPAGRALTSFLPVHSCFFRKPLSLTCAEGKCSFSDTQSLPFYPQDLDCGLQYLESSGKAK